MRRQIDNSVLEMALVGYNAKRDEVLQKMADIERRLGIRRKSGPNPAVSPNATTSARAKRTMSAAARKRIAAAQKKRWAAFHAKAGAPKPATQSAKQPRRKMSPEAKARLVANLAKARAAKAVKRAA